jgi:hypothetical protein
MTQCAPPSMKTFPLYKGGGAERQGVVWSAFLELVTTTPEGFAFVPL